MKNKLTAAQIDALNLLHQGTGYFESGRLVVRNWAGGVIGRIDPRVRLALRDGGHTREEWSDTFQTRVVRPA